jgi:hypothetical protein
MPPLIELMLKGTALLTSRTVSAQPPALARQPDLRYPSIAGHLTPRALADV